MNFYKILHVSRGHARICMCSSKIKTQGQNQSRDLSIRVEFFKEKNNKNIT